MEKNTINKRTSKEKALLVFSFVIGVGLTPFAFFRIINENWTMVAVDAVTILGSAFVYTYVHRTHYTKCSGWIFLSIVQVGSVISFYINGGQTINWVYPAMLTTFFIAKPRHALMINFVVLLLYFPKLLTAFEITEIIIIVFSVLFSCISVYLFAEGLRVQEQELKKIASEDYLTETGNRRALKLFLDTLWVKLQKGNNPVTLIILDIDHFKKINDEYGHLVGDTALVNISKLIKQMIGEKKPVFRYGGEEFLIVCSCNETEAFELADTIREKVKNTDLIIQTRMTISLGVAQYHNQETITQWIHRVDKALYRAKNQGRDCVIKV